MLKVKPVNPNKPFRFCIYGEEGIGKSTFGAKAEKPVFISAEGGADQLTDIYGKEVQEFGDIKTWQDVRQAVKDLIAFPHDFKTLVIDSADWIESLAHKEILSGKGDKTIITVDGGYMSGYNKSKTMLQELITDLEQLRLTKGMNVIFTAHSEAKEKKDPMAPENYHRNKIKCDDRFSEALIEWMDALFYVGLETFVKKEKDSKQGRAFGSGKRLLYTTQQPSFRAKNRYGMPEIFEFDQNNIWQQMMPYINRGYKQASAEELFKEASELLVLVTDADVKSSAEKFINDNKTHILNLQATIDRLKVLTKGEQ